MNTRQPTPGPIPRQARNRITLLAIAVLFLGTFVVAGVLRFSGWRPAGTRNHGTLLAPPGDLRRVSLATVEGAVYPWAPIERRWRLLVAPAADCGVACVKLARDLDTVWQLSGRDADRVDILWAGPVPADAVRGVAFREVRVDPALRAGLPGLDDGASDGVAGPPVYVVDPNGFVILRYAAGFDPGHLRQDLGRLLRLK
ncbi:MAG TPA: hypothetical protein VLK29_01415 [Luteimonas sp.]|nr:hypothetical protein [Luteimonas sp.]